MEVPIVVLTYSVFLFFCRQSPNFVASLIAASAAPVLPGCEAPTAQGAKAALAFPDSLIGRTLMIWNFVDRFFKVCEAGKIR